jgi:hypothetical protein
MERKPIKAMLSAEFTQFRDDLFRLYPLFRFRRLQYGYRHPVFYNGDSFPFDHTLE